MPALDASAFPHLVDQVFNHAPHASLLALRTASRAFKLRADETLGRSISIVASADTSPALKIRTPENKRLPYLQEWEEDASTCPLAHLSPTIADIYLSHPITPGIEAAFTALAINPAIVRYRGSVANYRPVAAPLSVGVASLSNPNIDSESDLDMSDGRPGECATLMTYTCDVGAPSAEGEYVIGVKFDPNHVHLPEAWIGGLGQASVRSVTVVFVEAALGSAGCRCVAGAGGNDGEGAMAALSSLRMVPFAPRRSVTSLTLVNASALGMDVVEAPRRRPNGTSGAMPGGEEVGNATLGDVVRDRFRVQFRKRRDARVPPFRGWSDEEIDIAVGTIRLLTMEEWRAQVGADVFSLATEWKDSNRQGYI